MIMKPVVAIIAQGAMGSGVGARLVEQGLEVTTSLAGRSAASAERARGAGMKPVSDEEVAAADFFLSIVPPGDALTLAEKFAPIIKGGNHKPVYVDCNAVNPLTAVRIADVISESGAPFVDAGIIGGPPRRDGYRPAFYASGPDAARFAALTEFGVDARMIEGPIGAASAMKMSYAGITKGFTALGAAMMLAATRAGTAEALRQELSASQPALLSWLDRQMPQMFSKAYRWVAEMEEIAAFVADDAAARKNFEAAAELYERLAQDFDAKQEEIRALADFVKPRH
jgi:3-hydroxyisobutyrate dehydrogenase-like beta-hydroxyacid dehydrogenase